MAHELDTIPGVKEDVTNIILNLKQIRFKQITGGPQRREGDGQGVGHRCVHGWRLRKGPLRIRVLNPELVICNLDPSASFSMEYTINKGRGWVPADENREMLAGADPGVIAVDSIYTPIKNVKYAVENYRVEQKTDYEKLLIEVTTDGSIQPKDALKEAAKILIQHFMMFSDEKITLEAPRRTLPRSSMRKCSTCASCSRANWWIWTSPSVRSTV